MEIERVVEVTDEIVVAFARLIPQLSSSNPPPTRGELIELVASPATILFIARDPGRGHEIAGALTLALFRIPTGLRAWIEDVIVDAASRGKGVGEALCQVALQHARGVGATTVDLTSRPSRQAANRLYLHMGFEQRETNVYRYNLK